MGLMLGLIYCASLLYGVYKCGWNFLEWHSPHAFCNNQIILTFFYVPFGCIQILLVFIFTVLGLTNLDWAIIDWSIVIGPVIILLGISSLLGMYIGAIIDKKTNSSLQKKELR